MSKNSKASKPKPTFVDVRFRIPVGVEASNMSITPSGDLILRDKNVTEFTPVNFSRAVSHERPKGPKVRTRQFLNQGVGAIGGLRQLSQYDSIFVIDTNTKQIKGKSVSVAAFACCRIDSEFGNYRITCNEERINIYEFHNVLKKPELLAILKLAGDVSRSKYFKSSMRMAVVTDTELGIHDELNERRIPIYGDQYLPQGFELLYASADTGQEALNKIIRVCDRQAGKQLEELENEQVRTGHLQVLKEDRKVKFRVGFRNGRLTIKNPVIKEQQLDLSKGVTLMGLRKD